MSFDFPVAMERQHQTSWCWAAVVSSIVNYYGTGPITQCRTAAQVLGRPECDAGACVPQGHPACDNDEFALELALEQFGHRGPISAGPAASSFQLSLIKTILEDQFDLDPPRPVCAGIRFPEGIQHFILIRGYSWSPGADQINIEDPLYGPGWMYLSEVIGNYRLLGGTWEHTYQTLPGGS